MAQDTASARTGVGSADASNTPLAIVGLALGMLLSALDQTIVATALPRIAADVGGLGSIGWVATAYLLGSTATAPLYGRGSDRYGRRATFLAAVGIFTVASVLCGLATSLGQLVAFRALQGVGAGALFVLPTLALSELVEPGRRGRAQGYLGGVFALGSLGGPLAGGLLTDALDWRWIFYVNLPLGLISMALVGAALRLPRVGNRERIDAAGSVLLVATVTCVTLAATWGGRTYPWTSGTVLGLGAAAFVLFFAFGWRARRVANPVIPPRLLVDPVPRVALPATALLGALMYGAIFFLPTYFQEALGMGATSAGLALVPAVVALVAASAISGRLAGAAGRYRRFLIAGAATIAAGYALLSRLGVESGYAAVALGIIVCGFGFGLMVQPLVVVARNALDPADLGATTSAVLSVRGMGMALGVAFFGTVLARRLEELGPARDAFAVALPDVFAWGVPGALVLLLLALVLPRQKPSGSGAAED